MKNFTKAYKNFMVIFLVLELVMLIFSLIYAMPIGIWLCTQLSLTITSGFLQFILGLIFFWCVGSIVASILGVIMTAIFVIVFTKKLVDRS